MAQNNILVPILKATAVKNKKGHKIIINGPKKVEMAQSKFQSNNQVVQSTGKGWILNKVNLWGSIHKTKLSSPTEVAPFFPSQEMLVSHAIRSHLSKVLMPFILVKAS